jgi:hypothetical protein
MSYHRKLNMTSLNHSNMDYYYYLDNGSFEAYLFSIHYILKPLFIYYINNGVIIGLDY